MTLRETQKWLESQFFQGFSSEERTYSARLIVEKVSGYPAHSWWVEHAQKNFDSFQIAESSMLAQRISVGEPIQYVLGEAWFLGHLFKITPSVLIPRPETEELCNFILKSIGNGFKGKILEIGTGSGCIAISLGKALPSAQIMGTDISNRALLVAKENATRLAVDVEFFEHNILKGLPSEIDTIDLLVSNPPYIPPENIVEMKRNVVAYEPHIALFTPSGDPLLFYRKIATEGRRILNTGGEIWFEVHEDFADGVLELLNTLGYSDTKILKDFRDCRRFVTGQAHFLG
jgi:release factor glutamine methyltransferase